MDLVRELKDVRFELNLRGYDCEAVDAFLAKLRSDVASVQKENDTAAGRISDLEAQLAQGGGASSETEGTLRRTLVLAQRLADETEADSKRSASELIETATAEANKLRADAESEAAAMRKEGETDLAESQREAAATRDATTEEAGQARTEMRQQVEAILSAAEDRGAERVVVIEQAAQESTAAMREPIRAEVAELEDVRRRLLIDIGELETHLEAQRVRVRTAVEALRVGMSGSIEDLERIAEDDELLATHPAPEHSGASADDVPMAPAVEIVDQVANTVPEPATVDEVEHDALLQMEPNVVEPELDPEPSVEVESSGPNTEPIPVIELEEATLVEEMPPEIDAAPIEDLALADPTPVDTASAPASAPLDGAPVEAIPVEDLEPVDAVSQSVPVIDDAPTIDASTPVATAADLEEVELVDLSSEPTGMFATEVGEVADAAPTTSSAVTAAGAVAGGGLAGAAAVGALGNNDSGVDDSEVAVAEVVEEAGEPVEAVPDEPQIAFVDRFAEALDALPITRS